MKARMQIITFVVVLLSCAVFAQSGFSNPELDVRFRANGEEVSHSTSVRIPNSGIEEELSVGGIRKPSLIVKRWNSLPVSSNPGICNPSSRDNGQTNTTYGVSVPGARFIVEYYYDRASGNLERTHYYCRTPNTADGDFPVPTYEDVWENLYSGVFNSVSIASAAYVAPSSPGLTGLPTNIWAVFPDGQTITQDVALPGGYRLQASAHISEVTVSIKTPKGNRKTLAALAPGNDGAIDGGSYSRPVVTHKFRSSGEHQITTAIIWSGGNAILSGGILSEPIVVPIGDVRLEINRTYQVNQLRPALTN